MLILSSIRKINNSLDINMSDNCYSHHSRIYTMPLTIKSKGTHVKSYNVNRVPVLPRMITKADEI